MIALLQILSWGINLIPKKLRYYLGKILGYAFYRLVGFRKNVISSNLKTAFGPSLSEVEVETLMRKNYEHYGVLFFEFLASVIWKKKDYLQNIHRVGWETLEELAEKKEPCILLTSHLGNWEYSIAVAAAVGLPIDVVVKEAKSAFADKYLQWYRRRTGAGIFLESGTAKDILKSLNQGRHVAFILDQFMGPPIGLPVKFFGKTAGTAAALALMTDKRDIPVIPAYNYRDENGVVHIVIEKPIEFKNLPEDRNERLYYKTQMYNDILESQVRKHPSQWLWLHRRWKDFRGESRWQIKSETVLATFSILFLLSCSSQQTTSPTGITLPSDPTISAPAISGKEKNLDDYNVTEEIKPVEPITAAPLPNEVADKKVKKGKKKMEQKIITPTPTPVMIPEGKVKAVDVVPSDKIPFEIGERLEINLGWLALPAGKAAIEVKEGPVMAGRPTFHFWGNVLSSKVVDAVYHVDNTIEAFVDKQALIPYKYLLHMLESVQKKETRVSFDHTNKKAYFWAKRISERYGPEDVDRQDAFVPESRDIFSALYFARTLNYQLNRKQKFMVYENANNWEVELLPVANELVTTSVGAFQCWKILVKVALNNVLKPTGDIYMWLSDDSKKYLVKFDAKIKIGSLYGNLTSVREH